MLVELVLEFIKNLWDICVDLLPLLIAIMTIYCNNKLQEEKRKCDLKQKHTDDLIEDIMELNNLVWEAGANLLEAIQRCENESDSKKYQDEFLLVTKKMLMKAREINGRCDILTITWNDELFHNISVLEETNDTYSKYMDVWTWYNETSQITPICQFDVLCDEVQKKLIEISQPMEDRLVIFCYKLNS